MSRTILGISAFSWCSCHAPIAVCGTASGSSVPGSPPEPTHNLAASHRATSHLAGTCRGLQVTSLELGEKNSPRVNITGPLGDPHPPAPFLNGAVGCWGMVAIADSRATPSLPWCTAARQLFPSQGLWPVSQEHGQCLSNMSVSIPPQQSSCTKSTRVLRGSLHQGQVRCRVKPFLLRTEMCLLVG